MYYVSEEDLKYNQAKNIIIINILTMPPEQRSLEDHSILFRFFHANKILSDIERLKSLNAKQQCVANLYSDTIRPSSVEDEKDSVIVVDNIIIEEEEKQKKKGVEVIKIKRTMHYVLLPSKIKQQIMAKDEKYLRLNIERIKKYMILKDLKYAQLLHLAYYLDQASYKYKQDVYRQGESPRYLYLVERGQFDYSKTIIDEKEPILKRKKHNSKRYQISDQTNRLRRSISVQMKMGVIEGGSGQSFGQSEIISQRPRQYTIKCMSTENLVIRIPQQRYKKILVGDKTKMDWLKKQNSKRNQLKIQILKKRAEMKNNHHKFAQMLSKSSLNKTEQIRMDAENPSPNSIYLPKIKSHSAASVDHFSKNINYKSIDKSRIIQEKDEEQQQSKVHYHSIDSLGKEEQKIKYRQVNEKLNTSNNTNDPSNSRGSLLPHIHTQNSRKRDHRLDGDVSFEKSWSASKPLVQLRSLRHKFSGMIDSNSLVKQKEQILNSKIGGKDANQDLYPMNFDAKRSNRAALAGMATKQEVREMRSAVHSKIFMQKLLVEALRKAGYNSQQENGNKNNKNLQQKSNSIQIKNNLRLPKPKAKIEKHGSDNLLVDNEFDECYFRKLE